MNESLRRENGPPQDSTRAPARPRFAFPRWANYLLPASIAVAVGGGTYLPVLLALAGSPMTTDVGYAPKQPVPFSHALHAGELGMDCRYCHFTVERAPFAALPPTQTCLNCHASIKADSPLLLPVRESGLTGNPLEWIKIHDLPDYSYFNHAAHVTRGVSCVACHGRIDRMEVVAQARPLSMAWCLECHRNPGPNLRPLTEITALGWEPPLEEREELQSRLLAQYEIRGTGPMTSCSTCHR